MNKKNDRLYKSVRKTAVLEDGWRFQIDIRNIGEAEKWFAESFDMSSWGKVTVPQAWDCYETALWGYEGIGWYAVEINPEDFTAGKRTEVLFNRVMFYSKVWINGEYIGENIGGYLPFNFDITDYLMPGQENRLVIRVDNKPRIEWLPAGKQIEWIQYGGILEPVELISTSHIYIDDFTIRTVPENGGARINCIAEIVNNTNKESEMELEIEIAGDTGITREKVKLKYKPNETSEINVNITMDSADLWSPKTPALYTAVVYLKKEDVIIDDLTERFGIRKISIEGTSILLNGEPLTIKGVNRYDEYGRLGPNVPEEILHKELALMKSVGINTIRVHYPQSSDLLSLYDEYGFMMLEEIPLNWWGLNWWGKVNQSLDILEYAKPALKKMITRDKNHPCVIIWSMANECETDSEIGITVMRELIRLAKSLDPTRLISFVSAGDPRKHLAFDEADIVCFNKYNGIFSGNICNHIAEIDSFACKPTAEEVSLYRKYYGDKPILITEFGAQGIKNIHGDARYTEDFQAVYIEKIWDAIQSVPGISGGVLWSWADYYHRKHFDTYAVYGPYGIVTVDRQPKESLKALSRMYGGSVPKQ
ncbi:glycoside hydrolase family 2 protein [candidate division KSB1 bacterium]